MKKEVITDSDYAKIIVHLDLDCFYAQVEQRRLGLSVSVPLCVSQWGNILAVNYAARKYGVVRNESVRDAQIKCPDLIAVHVATFAPGKKAGYHSNPNQATHKACLDVYRRASREIFSVIQSFTTEYQKGGTDEAYIDITKLVNDEIEKEQSLGKIEYIYDEKEKENVPVVNWSKGGSATKFMISADSNDIEFGWYNLRSYYGAIIAANIREAIFSQVGFTSSAGISHSRILSKLGSSLNKPNKQALVLKSGVDGFIGNLKLEKLRFLGGKLGKNIKELLSAETVSDMLRHSLEKLEGFFPAKTALFIYKSCRGIDPEIATSSSKPKSMSSVKSFGNISKLTNLKQVQDWLAVLSTDVWERLMEQQDTGRYWPKKLALTLVSTNNYREAVNTSTSFPTHFTPGIMNSPGPIIKNVMDLIIKQVLHPKNQKGLEGKAPGNRNTVPSIFPVERLLLHATGFYSYNPNFKNNQITNWVSESTLNVGEIKSGVLGPTQNQVEDTESHIVSSFSKKGHYSQLSDLPHKSTLSSSTKKATTRSPKRKASDLLLPKKRLMSYFNNCEIPNKLDSFKSATGDSEQPSGIHYESGPCLTASENIAIQAIDQTDDGPTLRLEAQDSTQAISLTDGTACNDSISVGFMKCLQCPKNEPDILIKDWDSHTDYHIALDLQTREEHAEKIASHISKSFRVIK